MISHMRSLWEKKCAVSPDNPNCEIAMSMVGHQKDQYTISLLNQRPSLQVCCRQMNDLNDALKKKRPALVNSKQIVLHLHNRWLTAHKIAVQGWEIGTSTLFSRRSTFPLTFVSAPAKFFVWKKLKNEPDVSQSTNYLHTGKRLLVIMEVI